MFKFGATRKQISGVAFIKVEFKKISTFKGNYTYLVTSYTLVYFFSLYAVRHISSALDDFGELSFLLLLRFISFLQMAAKH